MKLKINIYRKSGKTDSQQMIALINYGYKEFDVSKGTHKYFPLHYYLGLTIHKKDWNDELNIPKDRQTQAKLIEYENQIRDVFNYLKMSSDDLIHPNRLKELLDQKIKGKATFDVLRIRIVDFIENEILTSDKFEKKTKDCYQVLINHITDFEKQKGQLLFANSLNKDLCDGLTASIENKPNINRRNSVWAAMKDFNSTLSKIEEKYDIKVYKPKNDRVKYTEEDKLALNYHQIQEILNYTPPTTSLANIRAIFLTLIFTGCRFSDVFKVKPEHHLERNETSFHYSRFLTKKGDKELILPIPIPLYQVLMELGGSCKKISDVHFITQVKILCEKIGFTELITMKVKDSKGKNQLITKPFFEYIASHIGRRSFVTNLINYIPMPMLAKITAHDFFENDTMLIKYNKLPLLENAYQFVKHIKRVQKEDPDHFLIKLF